MALSEPSSVGLAVWTLVSAFLGALLGVAGRRAGVDVYQISKEYVRKWFHNYEYRDSELKIKLERIPADITYCCDILGTSSRTEIDYDNWKKAKNYYEEEIQDEFEHVIEDLKKRGYYDSDLNQQRFHAQNYLYKLSWWEEYFEDSGITPEHFFQHKFEDIGKTKQEKFVDDKDLAKGALEVLAEMTEEKAEDMEI